MQASVRKKVNEILQQLEGEGQAMAMTDPVARMMLVALAHEADGIERGMDSALERLSEGFVNKVLSNAGVQPQPAVSVLKIENGREYTSYFIDGTTAFGHGRSKCNYRPLLPVRIVPGTTVGWYGDGFLHFPYREAVGVEHGSGAVHGNELWVAFAPASEVDSLGGLVMALNHPLGDGRGLSARIGRRSFRLVGVPDSSLYVTGDNMTLTEYWKSRLVFHRLWLYRFEPDETDTALACSSMPDWFYDMYDAETLAPLTSSRLLWIRIAGEGELKLPADLHIELNCVPVANYDMHTAKLSYTEPIKPLDNSKNGSRFYSVVPDSDVAGEYLVRDFDVEQYDNGRLADDIRSLYRHYTDDYFAFVDSNALTDGVVLRNLRMSMLQVMDALGDGKENARPYAGSYIIRTPKTGSKPIAVSYLTTQGMRGNMLRSGEKLSSGLAATGEVIALMDALGGRDKICGRVGKRELARLIVHSDSRIFTDMDLMQFCRVELLRALGDDALRYCGIELGEKTVAVENHIERQKTVTLDFSNERYLEHATALNLDRYLEVAVRNRSTMNIKVKMQYV